MKNEFYQKEEFYQWLIESLGISEPSAKSYLSYVSGANKTIEIGNNSPYRLFDILNNNTSNSKISKNAIDFVIQQLSRKDAEMRFGRPLKTLRNYKSGLYAYLEFLIENDSIESEEEQILEEEQTDLLDAITYLTHEFSEPQSASEEIIYEYSKKDIFANFKSRINSQDRTYDNIYYPIRFIVSYFSIIGNRKAFEKWNEQLIGSIHLFVENKKIKLSEIEKMIFNNSANVFVSIKGKTFQVFTKLADNVTLAPLKTSSIKQIAIDHETPLYDIMNKNISNLKYFNLITNEIKTQIQKNENEFKKLKLSKYKQLSRVSSQKFIKENYSENFIKSINPNDLLKELDLIASKTNLQLMDSKQNTSKGKN
ncbi:hypothetical protein PG593_10855 [Riemerella anatipestifer]|nr:hypothetical protein [Riemerella anatipestifer]